MPSASVTITVTDRPTFRDNERNANFRSDITIVNSS